MDLSELGWSSYFAHALEESEYKDLTPARVTRHLKHHYQVWCEKGEFTGKIAGSIRHKATNKGMFPAVGDWVMVKLREKEGTARIHEVLPRKTKFSRKVILSATDEQVVATNIDTVFLVTSLGSDKDFSLRRIERYIALSKESGANPVILLNKIDLCPDFKEYKSQVDEIAGDIPVFCVSALHGLNLEPLHNYLITGQTVALLGSSGVGKSALINAFIGEEISLTGDVREKDGAGRHTTTHRELFWLSSGGALIDTPGMRELQLWSNETSFKEAFSDIIELSYQCRFTDCLHETEPGCKVVEGLESGHLDLDRYNNYLKMKEELDLLKKKQEEVAKTRERISNPKKQTWTRKSNKKNRRY